MRTVYIVFKWICYVALLLVILSFAALFLPFTFDLCDQNGAQVSCVSPFWRNIFEVGFTGAMMTVYLGLPGILAAIGAIFLIIEIVLGFTRRNE